MLWIFLSILLIVLIAGYLHYRKLREGAFIYIGSDKEKYEDAYIGILYGN